MEKKNCFYVKKNNKKKRRKATLYRDINDFGFAKKKKRKHPLQKQAVEET